MGARDGFNAVEDATKRLMDAQADVFLKGLLSDSEMDAIQKRREKKALMKAKKLGKKVRIREVKPDEYLIKGGGVEFDADGDRILRVDDFDILAYMQDAEDPATGTIRDLKIDTRDLAHAKNYYDFTVNIMGKDKGKFSIPWARQMWIGLILFGEVCPCCSHPKVFDIHNIPKDLDVDRLLKRMVLLEYGICPKCKRHKWDLIKNHGLNHYRQLVNVLGQRSGKSSSAAGYFGYMAHRYLMFPNLAELVPDMMQASTQLTCTMVSLNFNKAVGVLWTPFKKMIDNSSWFQEYFKVLDHANTKGHRHELYQNSTYYLTFQHKNLRFYPSGPNSTTLRGDTRIGAGLDELGLFPLPKGNDEEDEQSERANADEAHKSLTNSLLTVQKATTKLLQSGFSAAPPAVMLNVSSPYSLRDKVMRLLKESRTDVGSKYILGINLPTWEMHPAMSRDDPEIVMAYNSNPEKAERDFGANPPTVHSRYMPLSIIKRELFTGGQNSHLFTYQYDRAGELYGKLQRNRSTRWPALVTIDAGVVNNSFTLCGGHYDFDSGKSVLTTVIECMPHDGLRINHNMMYQHVILPLLKELNAVALLADQWQSVDILNRAIDDMGKNPLQKPRCLARQYSPRRKDFDAVTSMIGQQNIVLPNIKEDEWDLVMDGRVENYRNDMFGKPIAHLLLQFTTVKDVGPERCPEKGDDFTDDIYRSFALWASKLHDKSVMDRLREAKDWVYDGSGRKNPTPMFVSRGGMGGFRGLR
jgi:hypothetical protein